MKEIRRAPLFSWFKITWTEGNLIPYGIEEKFIITNNYVSLNRKTDKLFWLDETKDWISRKWRFSTDDEILEEKLDILSVYFLNHREPKIRVSGCDLPNLTIEIKRFNGEKIKEEYKGTLKDNDFGRLLEYIEDFIPKNAPRPYFIDGVPYYGDEVEE